MKTFSDKEIIESWKQNAVPWTAAVRQRQIESRKLVTDRAIIDAVLSVSPKTALDIGCGEGWLVRELAARGISATGIDAIPELIEKARESGEGSYRVLAYDQLSAAGLDAYDLAVCNFSLFGKESVEGLFGAIPTILNDNGIFIVQTVHPQGITPYTDGWREGSWAGLDSQFGDPPPWYFRTLESWFDLYRNHDFKIETIEEPVNPNTGAAASLLLIATRAA